MKRGTRTILPGYLLKFLCDLKNKGNNLVQWNLKLRALIIYILVGSHLHQVYPFDLSLFKQGLWDKVVMEDFVITLMHAS